MRRIFGLALVLTGALALSASISVAGASSKFAYTEEVTNTGSLVLGFDEGSLKRFASVDYQLDATASAIWDLSGGQSIGVLYSPRTSVTLSPDDRGRVSGALTLDISQSGGCTCGPLRHVEYTDLTLTNLSTGHVYRLDSISRDFPT